jgi:hypothetical protein
MNNYKTKKEIKDTRIPRTIIIANNKKQNSIKNILLLRDEMIYHKIDDNLIKQFIDEQYNIINKEYDEKIKKFEKNNDVKSKKIRLTEIKKKRKKAVDFLLKNKFFMEEHSVNKESIKNYVDKEYDEINKYYNYNNIDRYTDINLDYINFIDL